MRKLAVLALLAVACPAAARDSLGIFGQWGAFRDKGAVRCYAIAQPEKSKAAREYRPFASVGTWPGRNTRGQIHIRLSRRLAPGAVPSLSIAGTRFGLVGGGGEAWAADRTADAAIVAAMRSARSMTVSGRDARGRRFSDRYPLAGAATALDAASLGCSKGRR